MRQARFIGYLAQTESVRWAAAQVGCSRETAYRLRRKPGAGSFVHAWDAVVALRAGGDAPQRKVTREELFQWAMDGPFVIIMRRGKFIRACRKVNNTALLRVLSQFDRSRFIRASGF